MNKIFAICLTILLFVSCLGMRHENGYRYWKKDKKDYFRFQESYSIDDTIILSDYIYFSFDRNEGGSPVSCNDDSLFFIVKNSLKKLNIPIQFIPDHENRAIDKYALELITRMSNHPNTIDTNYIIELANKFPNKTVLIPFFSNNYTNLHFGEAHGYEYFNFLDLNIFIIRNSSIIYYKHLFHEESVIGGLHPYKYTDFYIPIPQEHWDGIVKEVMKEYIERLK